MSQQGVLDLRGRHPDPADLDQVVRPAAVPEVPVRVSLEQVARANGVAAEGLFGLLVLAPVEKGRRVALDRELAVLVQMRRVAGDELARAARAHAPTAVRDVDVVRLGRADPVEHLDPEGRAPPFVELAGERLASGRAEAQAGEI